MRPLLLLFVSACGATPYLEPVQTDSQLVQGPATPVDCAALCVRVKPQLVRDFGFTDAQIDCGTATFHAASDCTACRALFRQQFAVELTTCP